MKLSTNIMCFQQVLGLEKTISVFADAGFEAIEFNCDIEEYYTDAHDKEYYKNIKKLCNDSGIEVVQTHAPFRFGSDMADIKKAEKHFEEIIKGMENSSYLGAEMIVVHPLRCNDLAMEKEKDMLFEYNFKYYKSMIPYAEAFGVKIAVENISDSITTTAEGLLELYNALDNKIFTICCDVGHANIYDNNPAGLIRKLGKNIGCTHIHDNDGTSDGHTLPFYGTINWEEVMKAFAEIDYSGNLNYEAGLFVKNVPVSLRNKSAVYMAEAGRYLIDRYWHYKKQ